MATEERGQQRGISRRRFLSVTGAGAAALLVGAWPLGAYQARAQSGQLSETIGYGPLVDKGELRLPAEFHYQVISRQGIPKRDGRPTPGVFDAMGAFPGEPRSDTTILIRNHENRERPGEIKVVTGPGLEYNESSFGGNTKVVVRRDKAPGTDAFGNQVYTYMVVDQFAILGGTSTNCAGGMRSPQRWLSCEEVVKRTNGKKHVYTFEIDARTDGPVPAIPLPQLGRFVHEAAIERAGIIYETEDRGLQPDPVLGTIGACFYRYIPEPRGGGVPLAATTGPLQALAIKGEPHVNMDTGRVPDVQYPVEWVPVPEPDHEDDTDNRRDRAPGFTPTRIQAQDNGAAYFDRQEGMWAGPGDQAKVYFDCTTGGAQNLGQVWEYDAGRETLTLIYESVDRNMLENPDNVVVVPQTQDIFLCEDSSGEQFVRGVTQDGQIYNFAQTTVNDTEFCGATFDPDGQTLYLNQQGGRGFLPEGLPEARAVTYAIYDPFEKRFGENSKNFGTGPSR